LPGGKDDGVQIQRGKIPLELFKKEGSDELNTFFGSNSALSSYMFTLTDKMQNCGF